MANRLIHFQNVLKSKNTHADRLNVLYSWIKGNTISFKQFKQLLKYCEEVEDIKDQEFYDTLEFIENFATKDIAKRGVK
jgi:hypothetical protein